MSYYILAYRKIVLGAEIPEAGPEVPEEGVPLPGIDFLGVIPYRNIRTRLFPVAKDDRKGEPWKLRIRRPPKRRFYRRSPVVPAILRFRIRRAAV